MNVKGLGLAVVALAGLLTSGCETLKIHDGNQKSLAAALVEIEKGTPTSLSKAEGRMRQILSDTGSVRSDYPVQRFFAQYLLARIHMEASGDSAYLKEPKGKGLLGSGGGVRPSPTGHLLATNYNAYLGIDMEGTARSKRTTLEGKALLPPELESLGVEGASSYLKLCILTVYSQLLFETESWAILDAIGATNARTLETAIDEGSATDKMKPWIYFAMWKREKDSSPERAFSYAASALASEDALKLDREIHHPHIERWLATDEFSFLCNVCGKEVRAESMLCWYCDEDTPFSDAEYVTKTDLETRANESSGD